MKTKLNPFLNETASALLVTLFIMTILATSIAGYLYYVEQQAFLGSRAQAWNMAITVSEAGVEEGLEQLNCNTLNLAADGWMANGSVYSLTRPFPSGNSYTISLYMSNPASPVLISRANVSPPMLAQIVPNTCFATIGLNMPTTPTNVSRAVQVRISKGNLFLAAMVAKHGIDMHGNNVTTDSYDSSDPTKSTNGRYDPAKAGDFGDVASNDGVADTVNIGNANIYGHVYVGPGGTVGIGSQGGVGTHAWQAANGNTPEPNYVLNNANFTFPDTTLPYNSGITPMPGAILTASGTTTNDIVVNGATTLPPPPGPGQTIGPITTNTFTSTSSLYPGTQPGLVTNTISVTSNTYPGNVAGLVTNLIGFTTVSNYPGSQPGLSTNILATKSTTTTGYPAPGTYTGIVTTNWQDKGNGKISSYTYNLITSKSYTYANVFSYTYPTYSYNYTTYTYDYTIYASTPTYTTNNYDNVLSTGNYYATSLSGQTIVTGNATLVMPNGLGMSGNDTITIQSGASLTLYCGGTSFSIGGNGVVNQAGLAASFIVFCTPSVTDFSLNGNEAFTGVLVAPNANARMNGGGNDTQDFCGSLFVNSVTMNGHFNFHYDQALSRMAGNGRFLITSWDEIP